MSDLSKQAGFLSIAEFFRFFVKTIIGIVLARILIPADLGSYRQLFLIYTTLSTILFLGIPQSMLYFIPKASNPDETKRIITRTLNLISVLAIICSVVIILTRSTISQRFNNPDLNNLLLIYSIYPLFMFITQIHNSVMLGLKEPRRVARFTLFSVLSDFIIILSVALFTKNISLIVWSVIVSASLQWVYASISLHKYRDQFSFNHFHGVRTQLSYTIPLGVSSIVGILSIQLDKFMVSGFFTPAQFAVFSIGAMELPFIGILVNSVNSILLPNMGSKDISKMGEIYSASVRKNSLLVFPLTLLFYIFSSEIIVFFYGSSYLEAASFFRIYLLILPLRIATYGIIFQAVGKTKVILVNSIFVLVMNVVLNFVMIKAIGMKGAAFATVIVTWCSAVFYLLWMKFSLGLKLLNFFPVIRILKTALSSLFAALSSMLLIPYISSSLLKIICGSLLFLVTYAFFGIILKAILPYDIDVVYSIFRDSCKRAYAICGAIGFRKNQIDNRHQ